MHKNGDISAPAETVHPLIAIADYVALSLLALLFFPVLLFTVELYTRTGGTMKWGLPIAVAIAMPIAYLKFMENQPRLAQLAAVLLLVASVAKAFFISGLFYDDSSDSLAYHADGILQLLKDINPIYQQMRGFDDIWTNHYPKALWYYASLVIHATGDYNLGKSYNLLLIYAVFFYVFSIMMRRTFNIGTALLVAVAVCVNPVAVSQFNAYYVDGALASLMTLVVFSTLMVLSTPSAIDRTIFLMAGCLLINVKFTGAAYLFVIYGMASAALWWKHHSKPKVRTLVVEPPLRALITPIFVVIFLGGFVMGFNPYIQNTLKEGNPLFPLFGNSAGKDVVAAQSPHSFNENHTPTISKFLLSVFSKSENVIYQHGTAEPQLKIPFSVSNDELQVFTYNDVRLAGWGVWFGGTLLFAVLLYARSSSWKEREISVLLIALLITLIINPGSWWARYAPQAALLPVLMALPSLVSTRRSHSITAKFICVLMLLNSVLILCPTLVAAYHNTKALNQQIDAILNACGPGEYKISGNNGYHVEPLLWNKGITLAYVKEDLAKTHRNSVFSLLTQEADARLYKNGCTAGAARP